ncbi:unnamed protein product [Pleuronectes platessa]|uniref:Uncharacterized protein n=1 Tax=Pleuronectes platessa TaxID=8262 RepID=A0A9N7VXT2_PLEPL|nr:unnamed protein product [Pleuronectes platessa]
MVGLPSVTQNKFSFIFLRLAESVRRQTSSLDSCHSLPPFLPLAGVSPTLWPLGCSSSAAHRDKASPSRLHANEDRACGCKVQCRKCAVCQVVPGPGSGVVGGATANPRLRLFLRDMSAGVSFGAWGTIREGLTVFSSVVTECAHTPPVAPLTPPPIFLYIPWRLASLWVPDTPEG